MPAAENLRARQSVAKDLILVELPDDFFRTCDLENLRVLFAGMAIADDEIAVVRFGQERRPLESDAGVRNGVLDFPNDLAGRRDLDDAGAAARGNQRVAVAQAESAPKTRVLIGYSQTTSLLALYSVTTPGFSAQTR